MWSDLITCIGSNADIKYKLSFLNTLVNVHGINLENQNEINLVKSKIKEFCTDSTQRTGGLLLLYAVVHCSSTLYVDNWSQIVLGSLKIPDSFISREIPLKVLNRMLVNFGRDPDYSDVFSKLIPDIFPSLLSPENDKIYKLSCQSLAFCMKYIPEIAGTIVADIEKLLLKELNNPYGEIVEAIGECFAALPSCIFCLQRKGADGKVDYKQIWCNLFAKVLNTINMLLNNLTRLPEDHEDYVDVKNLPVFAISLEKDNDIPLSLIDIIKSLCQCMAKMMSSENQLVRLPVSDLLKTLTRIIEVQKIIKDQNQDLWIGYLKLGYSQMLIGTYVVLEALILNFSIIEQGRNFVDLMNKSLNAIEKTSFSQSSLSQVKGSTWKLINVWLNQYGSKGSQVIADNKTILQHILADIKIGEKKSIESQQLETTRSDGSMKMANKIFACNHALKVLKNLLETNNYHLQKNHLDEICSMLLRISKEVIRHISQLKSSPVPYSDEKCRIRLYDVLLCCAIYSDPLYSKCILEVQNIFQDAWSTDTSTKVRRICHRFRKLSRYYLNPRKPPPDAVQYSYPKWLNIVQQPVIEGVRSEWGNGTEWNSANGPSSDDQMDDNDVAQDQGENAYSDKMESEGDLMPIEQIEENERHMNHGYSRKSSQPMVEEDSIDDSDIEPTYVSTDSNPQRIGMNDSSHINSFGMQSCVVQYASETRTDRHASEEVPSMRNTVENDFEEHVSAFVEVKSAAQKPSQVAMGNGEWRRKENSVDSDEDDSDMEEEGDEEGEAKEGDEEGEVNEEVSDNAADEASDGKRSPDFDEERPNKRQRCMDEEGDDDMDEDVEDEDAPVNNQSSDEEENEVNNFHAVGKNAGSNSENLIEEESQDDNEDTSCRSPTIREMCNDFVLAEPTAAEIS
ncbi:unnamed protein product [Larinioides sclopetarius]|uniref:Uncharacterized protein n=1 Tax=Larinioides sclopetarius TaxID=280406 RepID=A0AAV1YTQ6_9ARAC